MEAAQAHRVPDSCLGQLCEWEPCTGLCPAEQSEAGVHPRKQHTDPSQPRGPGVTWHEETVAQAGQEAVLHATHLAAGQLRLGRGLGPRKAPARL